MTVTILGTVHAVTLPSGPTAFAERREMLILAAGNTWRGAAAVLAVCCPSLDLKASRYRAAGITADFGARAWEEMSGRKVLDMDMFAAAQPIIAALNEASFPSAGEVAAAESFTAPHGGPPT